jgi:gamma-glutamyltranspeptidase/glutathione hydrolase
MDLQAANDAPAFHTDHLASSFFPRECNLGHLAIEGRFAREVYAELDRRGHRLDIYGDYDLGYVTAATREGGTLRAAASPRGSHCYATGR